MTQREVWEKSHSVSRVSLSSFDIMNAEEWFFINQNIFKQFTTQRISSILNFLPLPSSARTNVWSSVVELRCLSSLEFDVQQFCSTTTVVWVIQSCLWVMSFFKILKINVENSFSVSSNDMISDKFSCLCKNILAWGWEIPSISMKIKNRNENKS